MEAFLTGFLYVLGGGVGLAALGVLLGGAAGSVARFRGRRKEKVATAGKDERKRLLLESEGRADALLESDDRVAAIVEGLKTVEGKYQRSKLQRELRELVTDEGVRRVFYSRTR